MQASFPAFPNEPDRLGHRFIQLRINDERVVKPPRAGLGDFTAGFGEALLDEFLRLPLSAAKSHKQFFFARRENEDRKGVGHALFDLLRAFDIDFEDDQPAARQLLLDPPPRRAVALAEDIGPFEELIVLDHVVELGVIDEVVIDAFDIGGGLWPGRGRDAEDGARDAAFDASGDGGFADTAGPADDEQHAIVGVSCEPAIHADRVGRLVRVPACAAQQSAMPQIILESTSPEHTRDLARQIAAVLRPGDIVRLRGMLGAGKTTLIRALSEALGVNPAEVSSPTFVIANEYRGAHGVRIVHMDAYRLGGDAEELELLGWDGLAGPDAIVLIEWAERIEHLLAREGLNIDIEHIGQSERRITLTMPEDWADRALALDAPASPAKLRPTTCPVPGEAVAPDNPHYPFSSERARWADLYRWFSESYQVDRPADQADYEEHL